MSVAHISYHGWQDCYLISNGRVEAIVVPSIGRIMQLRLAGEEEGTFWENRELDGQVNNPASGEWLNFGGDKCWPAPQSAFPEYLGREWPPPLAFDSLPADATPCERGIVLTSPVDPSYGIQVVRRVELDAVRPAMRIGTEYRKVSGSPVRVAIWSITQMREPELISVLLPERPSFTNGYIRLLPPEPAGLRIDGRHLSLKRHPQELVKIGTEGSSAVWVGRDVLVRIDTAVEAGEYPDGGCVTEIYTNADPLKYVELESMSPLVTLMPGDRTAQSTTYTVMPRSVQKPECEAKQALGMPPS